MGTYRLARHLSSPSLVTDSWAGVSDSGRPVVVLRRKEPWSEQPGFLDRFASSQRGWQALRHADGVLPLVEVGQVDGAACIVQEFVEGEPVRLALTPGKTTFSVMESAAVVLQAVRGLLSLEQLSPALPHGDVSASTLLLGSDGAVRLEAIGVAAAHGPHPAHGPPRSELLTVSPEELAGQPGPTSDVFRLGLVWLELLTGKPAFGGANHAEVKTRFEQFPGVTPAHFSSLPQPIPMVLAMMLSKSPTSRPSVSDLELMVTQVYSAVGGTDSPTTPLLAAFQRIFPSRVNVATQLQGGSVINVVAPGAPTTEGAVKLGRINTRRMTSSDVAASRALEASDAARVAAKEWTQRHAREENPRDFTLGASLLELGRLTVAQADAALLHAQSLSATFFDSLCALDVLDEDEVLPIAASLLRQQCLTGPMLLELNLGPAQAELLSRDIAEDWQVIPLKSDGSALTVAVMDPTRADVLDDVKLRAKVRVVIALRATERTIEEGFARIYRGKTTPPTWATKASGPMEQRGDTLVAPKRISAAPVEDEPFELSEPDFSIPAAFPEAPAPRPPPSAPRPPPSPPRPPPSAPRPPTIVPVVGGQLLAPSELHGSLDVASRLFDALLSVMGERGLEASAMIALVRAVAKQAGATGAPLDQVRLSVTSVVIASLLEEKRAFEVPSRPATAACLGPHWRDFEDFVRPLLDGDEALPSDPRGVVLCLCFEVANLVHAVPSNLSDTQATLESLRSRYPPAALAALEIVLAGG